MNEMLEAIWTEFDLDTRIHLRLRSRSSLGS
jgi:hypothetical protein